jgi:hypothetical protein
LLPRVRACRRDNVSDAGHDVPKNARAPAELIPRDPLLLITCVCVARERLVESSLIFRVAQELHDEPELADTQRRGDLSDDPVVSGDFDTVANFKRRLSAQLSGRHDVLAATQLIEIEPHSRHAKRRTGRRLSQRDSPMPSKLAPHAPWPSRATRTIRFIREQALLFGIPSSPSRLQVSGSRANAPCASPHLRPGRTRERAGLFRSQVE